MRALSKDCVTQQSSLWRTLCVGWPAVLRMSSLAHLPAAHSSLPQGSGLITRDNRAPPQVPPPKHRLGRVQTGSKWNGKEEGWPSRPRPVGHGLSDIRSQSSAGCFVSAWHSAWPPRTFLAEGLLPFKSFVFKLVPQFQVLKMGNEAQRSVSNAREFGCSAGVIPSTAQLDTQGSGVRGKVSVL